MRPSGKNTLHYEVFTIDHVGAIASGAAEERDVPSFYSFGLSRGAQTGTCYSPRYRASVVDERLDTYVSFVEPNGADTTPDAETITFNLTCTNRRLAEALRIGDIKVPTDHTPAFVQFRNITVPTRVRVAAGRRRPALAADLASVAQLRFARGRAGVARRARAVQLRGAA